MSRELLQQALDALGKCLYPQHWQINAMKAIRAHLALPQPEPEEFDMADDGGCPVCGEDGGTSCGMPHCGLLSAPPVPQAEPVLWQQRWTNPGVNPNVSPEEVDWKPLELKGRTEAETLRDLVAYTYDGRPCYEVRALYTHPAAPAPLTDEQIDSMWRQPMSADWEHREFARAIEAHPGIAASPEKKP
jgi:hypothetical protein